MGVELEWDALASSEAVTGPAPIPPEEHTCNTYHPEPDLLRPDRLRRRAFIFHEGERLLHFRMVRICVLGPGAMTQWTTMTPSEIRKALVRGGCIVWAAARKGCRDKMPQTPVDVRRPRVKAALLQGRVVQVLEEQVKIEDDHGYGGWVDVTDVLFAVDFL